MVDYDVLGYMVDGLKDPTSDRHAKDFQTIVAVLKDPGRFHDNENPAFLGKVIELYPNGLQNLEEKKKIANSFGAPMLDAGFGYLLSQPEFKCLYAKDKDERLKDLTMAALDIVRCRQQPFKEHKGRCFTLLEDNILQLTYKDNDCDLSYAFPIYDKDVPHNNGFTLNLF